MGSHQGSELDDSQLREFAWDFFKSNQSAELIGVRQILGRRISLYEFVDSKRQNVIVNIIGRNYVFSGRYPIGIQEATIEIADYQLIVMPSESSAYLLPKAEVQHIYNAIDAKNLSIKENGQWFCTIDHSEHKFHTMGLPYPRDIERFWFKYPMQPCPRRIAEPISEILQTGLSEVQRMGLATGLPNRGDICAIHATHLQNLPSLITDYSETRLLNYWRVERNRFIEKANPQICRMFEIPWSRLEVIAAELNENSLNTKEVAVTT